jgi:hypothetical protein
MASLAVRTENRQHIPVVSGDAFTLWWLTSHAGQQNAADNRRHTYLHHPHVRRRQFTVMFRANLLSYS